jgi:hypothetical protein
VELEAMAAPYALLLSATNGPVAALPSCDTTGNACDDGSAVAGDTIVLGFAKAAAGDALVIRRDAECNGYGRVLLAKVLIRPRRDQKVMVARTPPMTAFFRTALL